MSHSRQRPSGDDALSGSPQSLHAGYVFGSVMVFFTLVRDGSQKTTEAYTGVSVFGFESGAAVQQGHSQFVFKRPAAYVQKG